MSLYKGESKFYSSLDSNKLNLWQFTVLSDHLVDGYFHVGFNHVLPAKYAIVMVGQTMWEQPSDMT